MGVLTKLSLKEINYLIKDSNIQFNSIEETLDGITDSTYIGFTKKNKKYIFKIFENLSFEDIKKKISLLNSLDELLISKVISSKPSIYNNKPGVLLSFIEGETPNKIDTEKIKEISKFLKKLHSINISKPMNKNVYEKKYLIEMINITNKQKFINRFELIKDINLANNCIIHGDLFPDNTKFINDKLSGVYDFTYSCYGNAYFDLAVVIISWCFEEYDFNLELSIKFLEYYDEKLLLNTIKPYLLYACLFYSLQRYIRDNKMRSYKELLKKFDILNKIL